MHQIKMYRQRSKKVFEHKSKMLQKRLFCKEETNQHFFEIKNEMIWGLYFKTYYDNKLQIFVVS
jgi:hypothetical protein